MGILLSPLRSPEKVTSPEVFYLFGYTPALNVLEGFDGSEPVEDDGTGLNVRQRLMKDDMMKGYYFLIFISRFSFWAVVT